jgi:hypothetical protein
MNEQKIKEALEAAFGKNLNPQQLWALVKFAKNVRLRCRNNAAFNNMMSRVFPHATFRQVQKIRADGSYYPGLSIAVENPAGGFVASEGDGDDE